MHFARKAAIFFVSLAFVVLLFALPALVAINHTIGNAATIKVWLKDSKLYDNAITGLVDQANKSIKDQASEPAKQNDINRPEIQAAAEKAFTPEFLQTSTESVIDGFFNWMNGKTPKPEFAIPLGAVKQKFADEVNASAKARYASLPICPRNQPIPTEFDPFTVTCRVPGFDANAEIDRQTNKIVTNNEALGGKDTFTADDIKPGGDNKQPVYKQLAFLPALYRLNRLGVIILVILILAAGAGLVFLYPSRRLGLRRVANKLITVGAFILVWAILIGSAFGVLNRKVETKSNGASSSLQQSGLYVVRHAEQAIENVDKWFGVGYVVIGASMLITLKYVLKPKPEHASTNTEDKPEKSNKPTSATTTKN